MRNPFCRLHLPEVNPGVNRTLYDFMACLRVLDNTAVAIAGSQGIRRQMAIMNAQARKEYVRLLAQGMDEALGQNTEMEELVRQEEWAYDKNGWVKIGGGRRRIRKRRRWAVKRQGIWLVLLSQMKNASWLSQIIQISQLHPT